MLPSFGAIISVTNAAGTHIFGGSSLLSEMSESGDFVHYKLDGVPKSAWTCLVRYALQWYVTQPKTSASFKQLHDKLSTAITGSGDIRTFALKHEALVVQARLVDSVLFIHFYALSCSSDLYQSVAHPDNVAAAMEATELLAWKGDYTLVTRFMRMCRKGAQLVAGALAESAMDRVAVLLERARTMVWPLRDVAIREGHRSATLVFDLVGFGRDVVADAYSKLYDTADAAAGLPMYGLVPQVAREFLAVLPAIVPQGLKRKSPISDLRPMQRIRREESQVGGVYREEAGGVVETKSEEYGWVPAGPNAEALVRLFPFEQSRDVDPFVATRVVGTRSPTGATTIIYERATTELSKDDGWDDAYDIPSPVYHPTSPPFPLEAKSTEETPSLAASGDSSEPATGGEAGPSIVTPQSGLASCVGGDDTPVLSMWARHIHEDPGDFVGGTGFLASWDLPEPGPLPCPMVDATPGWLSEHVDAASGCPRSYGSIILTPVIGQRVRGATGSAYYAVPCVQSTAEVAALPMIGTVPKGTTAMSLLKKQFVQPDRDDKWFVIGPLCLSHVPLQFSSSRENEMKALAGRHLKSTPNDPATVARWRSILPWTNELVDLIVPFRTGADMDGWVAGQQPATKRIALQRAIEDQLAITLKPDSAYRTFFTKRELLLCARSKCPRGIQGLQKMEMNLCLGPFIESWARAWHAYLRHELQRGEVPQVIYTGKFSRLELGSIHAKLLEDGYDYLEDDFSQYDASQGEGCHLTERAVFSRFGLDQTALNALDSQRYTKGFGRYYSYEIAYTRKSGDQNTSAGNSVLNAAAHVWCLRQAGVTDFHMMVMGDDNILYYKVSDTVRRGWGAKGLCERISEGMAQLGFVAKCTKNAFPTFCSADFMPVVADGQETMSLAPLCTRFLVKFGCTSELPPSGTSALSQLRGNALSNKILLCMPVARVVISYYINLGVVATPSNVWRAFDDDKGDSFESPASVKASDRVLEWFCAAYGVTATDVQELEEFLNAALHANCGEAFAWTHPVFERMLAHRPL